MCPKYFRLFFCIFLSPGIIQAQQSRVDSLKKQWLNESAIDLKQNAGTVKLLNALSAIYVQKVADSAYFFAERALKMSVQIHDLKGQVAALSNSAKMDYQKGNYASSLKKILSASRLSNSINDEDGLANTHNLTGLIYLAQDRVKPALDEFITASRINVKLHDRHRLAANYFNLGLIYFQLTKPDLSLHYFQECRALSATVNDQHMLAMSANRLGDYYSAHGQTKKAVNLYKEVLHSKVYKNNWENSYAYAGLAEIYLTNKRYNEAVNAGHASLLLAKKAGAKWDIERAVNVLQKSYRSLGNLQSAYDYALMDKLYSDSLFNESKEKEINGLYLKQQQADNEVLIKKNQLAQQENKISHMVILIFSLVVVLLSVTALLFYRSVLKKNNLNQLLEQKSADIARQNEIISFQNSELRELNQTKDQLFSVIGHDLRSPFSAILPTLDLLRAGEMNKQEQELLFDSFAEQVTLTSSMLENLLLWANSQQTGLIAKFSSFKPSDLMDQVLQIVKPAAAVKRIIIDHQEANSGIIEADINQVRIIFQNFISNAVKFTRPGGHIAINYQITNSAITVNVKDNGIGISADRLQHLFSWSGAGTSSYGTHNEKGIGIGLLLVKKFAGLNKAVIEVQSEDGVGTTFSVKFFAVV